MQQTHCYSRVSMIVIVMGFLCLTYTAFGQNIDSLNARKIRYDEMVKVYKDSVSYIEKQIWKASLKSLEKNGSLKTIIKYKTYVAESSDGSNILGYLLPGDSVTLHAVNDYRYYATSKKFNGYIGATSIEQTAQVNAFYDAQRQIELDQRQKAKGVTPTNQYSSPSSDRKNNSNRQIHTGPRGGKYYINSKGNKTYVKD